VSVRAHIATTWIALLTVSVTVSACSDPAHDARVDRWGGEVAGVPRGPLHRPGQACLDCHGGDGPGKSGFTAAGTVYETASNLVPVQGAQVVLTDAKGTAIIALTNAAGNFYLVRAQWDPVYPVTVNVAIGDVGEGMRTEIGGEGSCASCHFDPVSRASVGHVFAAKNVSDLP